MWIFNTKAVKLKKERKKPKNKQKSRAQKAIRDAKSNFSCRMVNGWEAQQSPKPHRTTRENPFSLTKIVSGWKFQGCKKKKKKGEKRKFQGCRFCLDIRKGLQTLSKANKRKNIFCEVVRSQSLGSGTALCRGRGPGLCSALGWQRPPRGFPARRLRGSTVVMRKPPFPSRALFVHLEARMVFATCLIHPEGDVCVPLWDLLMKETRRAQRLPEDLDSGNNRNSATDRLQLCLHNNSN